jgi:SAM-dependent methyltransferase/acyl carrier protein
LYRRWVTGEDLEIADFGCGTGYLLEKLIQMFPSSKFTGVERDAHLCSIARTRLGRYGTVIKDVVNCSISDFKPRLASFDVIFMRLVLEHAPDPVAMLRHIRSLLKGNGRVIIIDNDFDFHTRTFPSVKELDLLYNAYCRSRSEDGGDPCIGRNLPLLLRMAGYDALDLEILPAHNHLLNDTAFFNAEGAGIAAQLVKSGHLKSSDLDLMVKKWRRMLSEKDHVIYRQLFAVTGIRSENAVSEQGSKEQESISGVKTGLANTGDYLNDCQGIVIGFVAEILGVDRMNIDPVQSLVNAGLDSLGAQDLQGKMCNVYQFDMALSELLGGMSIKELVSRIINRQSMGISDNSRADQSSSQDEYGVV